MTSLHTAKPWHYCLLTILLTLSISFHQQFRVLISKATVKDKMPREGSVDSGEGGQRPRGPHREGGRANKFEPLSTKELTTSPTIVAYFQEVGCYDFCEKVQRVKSHPELTKIFILNLHNDQVHLAGVNFELSTNTIVWPLGYLACEKNGSNKWI